MKPRSEPARQASTWLLGFVSLICLALAQGCYQQKLDEEATHGLANDPYPVPPAHVAPTLRMLVWSETILDEVKAAFEKRYGVKLTVDTFATNDEAYDRLKEDPTKWDLIMVSQYMADRMRREGRLAAIPKRNDYIYHYIDTTVLNPKADPHMNYFIPFDYAALGISFNVNYVAGFPRKWEFLSVQKNDPYLYGRIVMLDDMRYAMAVALLYAGLDPSSTRPEDIQKAKQLLILNIREFGLRFIADENNAAEMLANRALLAITWNAEAAVVLKAKQECRFLIPEGKCVLTVDGFCLPRDGANPDTATLFIEFMLHPYNSMIVTDRTLYASVNMRSMKYADRFVINGPSCMVAPPENRVHMDYLNDEELRNYQTAWAEVKKAEIDSSKVNLIPLK